MPAVKIPKRKILRPYQKAGVRFCLGVRHPALFWKMRLGKTITCLRTCLLYRDCIRFLVVAPYSALAAWQEELAEEGQHFVPLYGTRQQRAALLRAEVPTGRVWYLLNREGHFVLPEIAGADWDVVILDESVFIANPGTKTTKYFTHHFRNVKHRWILCGTPAPESQLQYFSQLQFLDFHLLPERNYYQFRHHHFAVTGRHDWEVTPDGAKYIAHHLNKCALFLNRHDVKLGGVKIRERRAVTLPPGLMTSYRQLESEFYFELLGQPHETIFASQKYLWLKRLCGGFCEDISLRSEHKSDELLNLLRGELRGEQLVIWCEYIDEVIGVHDCLSRAGVSADFIYGAVSPANREKRRRSFQAGNIQVLVILTKTMHFSTKLTAASALIYFSSPEAALIREQSEDRHVDLSVSDNILIIDMPCSDTVEEDILNSHVEKEASSVMVERMVKSIQRRTA